MNKEKFIVKGKFTGEWEVVVEASNIEEAREKAFNNVFVSVDSKREDIEVKSAESETEEL